MGSRFLIALGPSVGVVGHEGHHPTRVPLRPQAAFLRKIWRGGLGVRALSEPLGAPQSQYWREI